MIDFPIVSCLGVSLFADLADPEALLLLLESWNAGTEVSVATQIGIDAKVGAGIDIPASKLNHLYYKTYFASRNTVF